MQLAELLDLLKRLIEAGQHPDITDVSVFSRGPELARNGVAVKDRWSGSTFLSGSDWKRESPVETPAVLPPPKKGVQRIATLTIMLLDAARPAQLQAWRPVALPDLGPTDARGATPAGLSIVCADGTHFLLRATQGGSQLPTPDEDPHPEWRVPEGLSI
ncbi:hypothetical protein [Actinoplanes sp. HUAS TT8]|uniref:hypothetical protein n=1 Tax=Actinoplanes sp. HUAS TT8 TaxID=3447453 RepID=UPI003F521BCD